MAIHVVYITVGVLAVSTAMGTKQDRGGSVGVLAVSTAMGTKLTV